MFFIHFSKKLNRKFHLPSHLVKAEMALGYLPGLNRALHKKKRFTSIRKAH